MCSFLVALMVSFAGNVEGGFVGSVTGALSGSFVGSLEGGFVGSLPCAYTGGFVGSLEGGFVISFPHSLTGSFAVNRLWYCGQYPSCFNGQFCRKFGD